MQVAVVGAGVSGLSCAVNLAARGDGVHVYGREFSPNTTSDVAAAMWWPFHAEPADKVLRWCLDSYRRFEELARDQTSGVVMREGTFAFAGSVPAWARAIPGAHVAPPESVPPDCGSAVLATAPVIEMNRYMPWLMRLCADLGVSAEQRSVESLTDLSADVVVNTSGLGAARLAGDDAVYPVRGRVVRVQQNGVDRFLGSESGPWPTHVFPRANDVVLGGTYEEKVTELDVPEEMDDEIVARAGRFEPRVRNAARIGAVTGLRPARFAVRLEAEKLGRTNVVHNYGHGGGGVTLSWGCAFEVASLIAGLTGISESGRDSVDGEM